MKSADFNLEKSLALYAVTDRHWATEQSLYEQCELALKGGATFLQIREKNLDSEAFEKEALELFALCRKYEVPFVVNDDVALAVKIGADGVHVGQQDMQAQEVRKLLGPDKILGVSAQTVEEAVLAEKQGADYLGVGAVFSTNMKDDANYVPYETLKAICDAVTIPVVAIGGITADNMHELKGSGICGVSVISSIFGKEDITAAASELKAKVAENF